MYDECELIAMLKKEGDWGHCRPVPMHSSLKEGKKFLSIDKTEEIICREGQGGAMPVLQR